MSDQDFKINDKRGATQEPSTSEDPKMDQQKTSDIGFANLIVSLGTSAMIHMGMIENPATKQKEKDLSSARQEIDLIMMLKDKTKGNLTDPEQKVIDQVIKELQIRYVDASKTS